MPTFDPSSLDGGTLALHQAQGLSWLLDTPRALLADHAGSGKTAQVLAMLGKLADDHKIGPGVARVLWVTEAHLIGQARRDMAALLPSVTVADSTEKWYKPKPSKATEVAYRQTFGPHGPTVTAVSYDHLRSRCADLAAERFGVAVFDEASALKGAGKEHAAAVLVSEHAARRVAISATPVECDVLETHAILDVLGVAGLPSADEWGQRYVTWSAGYQPVRGPAVEPRPIGIREDALPGLRAFLAPFMLRREPGDIGLPLPRLIVKPHWVQLTPPQWAAYRKMQSMPGLYGSQARERACGSGYARSAKAEGALRFLLENPQQGKAVIFAENHAHLDLMAGLLDQHGIGWLRVDGNTPTDARKRAVAAFRDDPGVRVLLGTKVLERGVDGLQHCSILISLGSSFNPGREDQRAGRLCRVRSPHPVVQHVVMLADTQHERAKWATVQRRGDDGDAVLGQLTA